MLFKKQRRAMTPSNLKWLLFLAVAIGLAALVRIVSPVAVRGAGAAVAFADALSCDMTQYRSGSGLMAGGSGVTASIDPNVLTVTWPGQNGSEMRVRYAIDGGQPIVRDLSVRKAGAAWVTLGQNLTPEYHVGSGLLRRSAIHRVSRHESPSHGRARDDEGRVDCL